MPTPRNPTAGRPRFAPTWAFALAAALSAVGPPSRAQGPAPGARQVTVFGVIATPHDDRIDPKLARIAPQLRKLLPDHGFRLLGVKGKRLGPGQTVSCNLEDGFTAAATLVVPADENDKVQLRCEVIRNQAVHLQTRVTTPANQLFFCEKQLDNGNRLLVGIGAR